ncbi:mitochondrial import inner membrane translocase subunit TIM9 [Blastocladiella britannica]|nr:mitochondrial import inner membrane translocase subunit TIM9 [Blastocladiella britannica]
MNLDFSSLSAQDRDHMTMLMEQKQMKESIRTYSAIIDRCFNSCIEEFHTSAMTTSEEKCVDKCVQKFLLHSERVSQRFAESNTMLQQRQMEDASSSQ